VLHDIPTKHALSHEATPRNAAPPHLPTILCSWINFMRSRADNPFSIADLALSESTREGVASSLDAGDERGGDGGRMVAADAPTDVFASSAPNSVGDGALSVVPVIGGGIVPGDEALSKLPQSSAPEETVEVHEVVAPSKPPHSSEAAPPPGEADSNPPHSVAVLGTGCS
jgi:hypothetical protein